MKNRLLVPAALVAASALTLAGCATGTGAGAEDDGTIQIVASTNVYGQIAEEIGGDLVEVTSIIDSASQDPHSYEPSAQDQLTISRADLVIENGGGYDAFIDALIESSGSEAHVVTAVESSHDWPENAGHEEETDADATASAEESDHDHEHAEGDGHGHVEGFNEHVWYDPHTIEHVAEAIATELAELAPDDADTFTANAETFAEGVHGLEESLAAIEGADAGAEVFATEPVPGYFVRAAGLTDVTPAEFSEAVEEGQDVPAATLLEATRLLEGGTVRVVITNTQTGGAETQQVVQTAEAAGIPVIQFAETLPEGQTYLSWMDENIAALAGALEA